MTGEVQEKIWLRWYKRAKAFFAGIFKWFSRFLPKWKETVPPATSAPIVPTASGPDTSLTQSEIIPSINAAPVKEHNTKETLEESTVVLDPSKVAPEMAQITPPTQHTNSVAKIQVKAKNSLNVSKEVMSEKVIPYLQTKEIAALKRASKDLNENVNLVKEKIQKEKVIALIKKDFPQEMIKALSLESINELPMLFSVDLELIVERVTRKRTTNYNPYLTYQNEVEYNTWDYEPLPIDISALQGHHVALGMSTFWRDCPIISYIHNSEVVRIYVGLNEDHKACFVTRGNSRYAKNTSWWSCTDLSSTIAQEFQEALAAEKALLKPARPT